MNLQNVRLIFLRELRDQLRDRRTLFMIFVLPLMLYPLLGMAFLQLSQFLREHKPLVAVVGKHELASLEDLPPLFEGENFATELLEATGVPKQMEISFLGESPYDAGGNSQQEAQRQLSEARQQLDAGIYEALVYFPPGFGPRLAAFHKEVRDAAAAPPQDSTAPGIESSDVEATAAPTQPEVYYNSANEKSRLAFSRVDIILNQWALEVGQQNLRDSHVPPLAARPFRALDKDVAVSQEKQAAVWSKILPFVVIIWALTGAFYPAVDLCAGEKERGTLETLLSSPALRNEIVWGKLLTIMIFSMATAVLNLFSLGLTGQFVIEQLQAVPGQGFSQLGAPPLAAGLWLLVALVPVAALFSALCLALAAVARSTKEGQYYLMPLVLVTMPLMILPMAPGIELNLGNSLIPLTGLVLLLRAMIEGNYWAALPYVLPVIGVTLICCLFAVRWAVEQFNKESVLFRESERLDLGRRLVHLVRNRRDTPSATEALACVLLIFVLQFFANFAMAHTSVQSYGGLLAIVIVGQLVILLPSLIMTLVLTRRPLQTLLLSRPPRASTIGVALLLACAFHPIGLQFATWISQLYPSSEETALQAQQIMQMLVEKAPFAWVPFLLLAALPALCEECTFRGFVLSGLRHLGHKSWAIGLSSIFFGMAHGLLQQSLAAIVVGMVIGYLAVQTASLIPCILFHAAYNSLTLLASKLTASAAQSQAADQWSIWRGVFDPVAAEAGGCIYHWPIVMAGGVTSLLLLRWLSKLPAQATEEERLEEIRERNTHHSLLGEA